MRADVVRTYDAEMGFNWSSDKLVSGDGATPEVRYFVGQMKQGSATLGGKGDDLFRRVEVGSPVTIIGAGRE